MDQMTAKTGAVVLVVDDDPALAESLKFSLGLEGFTVETYPDGESLLGARSWPSHGCMVIDVKLPGIDGLELLRRLRERKVKLPAVLITTHPAPSLRIHAAAESVPIVEKPLLRDELVETVRSLLNA
jgi:FixJ family two-component response regulator